MLVTSIFFFSHNVFKRLFLQSCLKSGLYGKELKSNVYAQSAHRLTFVCLFVCLGFYSISTVFCFPFRPFFTIKAHTVCYVHISMGESHTVVSAYTLYWHLNSIALTHQYYINIISYIHVYLGSQYTFPGTCFTSALDNNIFNPWLLSHWLL